MTTIIVTNSGAGAYIINGSSNPTISLIRGNTYNLVINVIGQHPFWIQTVPGGYDNTNIYNVGVTNNGNQAGSTITFVVPNNAPNTLYYNCEFHLSMRGIIIITDQVSPSPTQNIVCYKKGTLILTSQGVIPIENIKVGDNVITEGEIYNYKFIKQNTNLRIEPVIWIGKFKVDHLNSKSRPICIKKNAFDEDCPFQDLYISPQHCLLLDGKMITASNLLKNGNGNTIYQDMECTSVEYYHLECKTHCSIFANGVLTETYLDANNRYVFDK
jgi:hypothetical protein